MICDDYSGLSYSHVYGKDLIQTKQLYTRMSKIVTFNAKLNL